jgi:hypothetical protein
MCPNGPGAARREERSVAVYQRHKLATKARGKPVRLRRMLDPPGDFVKARNHPIHAEAAVSQRGYLCKVKGDVKRRHLCRIWGIWSHMR